MPTPDEIRRIAMISVHTSPLDQPGTGDAGGMNVYISEVAKRLAERGREVEIFTRATTGALPPVVELAPGVTVRHVTAGPYEGLGKNDLPGQLCAFAAGVMRAHAAAPEGWYHLVHSHYWLSGQVGWLAADRWRVPLVHTMHTMARVKNLHLAAGDTPEPAGREIGEAQVVEAAGMLVASTVDEARDLVELYSADPRRVSVVTPGVDLATFRPRDRRGARATLGLPLDAKLLIFAGRIQPLKAPDVLIRAAAELVRRHPDWRDSLVVGLLGGASGTGLARPHELGDLAASLQISDLVRFVPPVDRARLALWYAAADLVVVPSYSESFGLVAVEAGASGTPVVAAYVGGLPTAVGDGGVLVRGHATGPWADALEALLLDPGRRAELSRRALRHTARFGWDATADALLGAYGAALHGRTHVPIGGGARLAQVPAAMIP
ncbi:MAG TPA: D-inositol-3-phosphate glycosyltransferase [Candidatus Lustribacter sp.]|nr:D-inositol-3-phosphate glycosyltransferase [Candidatus Lustribacter sp.]